VQLIIIRHAPYQCVAPLATNSLHSDLSKASSIASSKSTAHCYLFCDVTFLTIISEFTEKNWKLTSVKLTSERIGVPDR